MQNVPFKKIQRNLISKALSFIFICICIVIIILAAMTITTMNIAQQEQTPNLTPTEGGPNSNWNLIFHDEFNGNSLDTSKWTPCYHSGNCTNSGNDEQEWYFPNNVSVSNGVLTLRAERRTYTAPDGKAYNYASGMISSVNFSFTYGYMEMRAKVAAGRGMWSAFWTLPADGSWPPEIDVQEVLGKDPTAVHMTYHYGANNSLNDTTWQGPDFSAGWHTFAVDWEPDAITWYVDGIERGQDTNASTITNKPMYLLANLAVGATWAGTPDTTTVFPGKYEIDYIRVWQKQEKSISTHQLTIPGHSVGGVGIVPISSPTNLDTNSNAPMLTRFSCSAHFELITYRLTATHFRCLRLTLLAP